MEIVETTQPRDIRLSAEFLAPYYVKGDPFTSLLARSTYLSKYCRDEETWTDTIKRVVEGNVCLAPGVTQQEAEMLFHVFWTMQALPPGRGLWTGGVAGLPPDARYNCFYTTLHGIDDWCWAANSLMLGGGVGVGLGEMSLPTVSDVECKLAVHCRPDHVNVNEVKPDGADYLNGSTPVYHIPDSREGWVEALRRVLTAAFHGRSLIMDVSEVRPRGAPIRTFGGVACGPGPLTHLLRSAWRLVRGARGRELTSVEALDVTNHIGLCIKAGNVRRSALVVLGNPDDQDFRNAKKDYQAVKSHRHTSNNSVVFRTQKELDDFDWAGLVEDNSVFGEPGILNLKKIRETDPGAMGVNPCFAPGTLVAVADGRNAVPIEQLAEEGRDVPVYSMDKATGLVEIKMGRHPRVTGYNQHLVRVWLDDGGFVDVTPDHKFVLLDGSLVEASNLEPGASLPRFTKALERVKEGSKNYYLIHGNTRDYSDCRVFEHRLIAKFHFPEEWDRVYEECQRNGFANTGGLVVHHEDYDQLNNSPDNLRIMTFKEHSKLHGELDQSGEKNGRWSGSTNEQIREHALELTRKIGRRFSKKEWVSYARENGLPQQFSKYRVQHLGTIKGLSELCIAELKLAHADEDPRVVRTYQRMLSMGYTAEIVDGKVLVTKICEACGSEFRVEHGYRGRSFCSESCGNLYINSDSSVRARRLVGHKEVFSQKMAATKIEQARVYSHLKLDLGRAPNRKEWSLACKDEGLPSRIGPTLTYGYRSFQEVAEAGENYNHKVTRVEELSGEHTVYNITVDDFHTVGVISSTREKCKGVSYTGVYVGNCGEVPLWDRENCNLAEIFPAKHSSEVSLETIFRLITRYTLRQRMVPLSDPKAQAVQEQNMRLGVGLGGICDFDWTPALLARWFGVVRREADDYADELGVSRPNAVSTIKPSGTISLLCDSSPGVHAPHAPYYIRRTRISANDPMAYAMMEAGVPYELDQYDQTGNTLVFEFPTKSPHTRVTKETQSLRDQFERQAVVQEWWADNSVSSTLSFDVETEREELAACLEEYVPRLKSTSCLPKAHGYAQAPYETIDQARYEELAAKIDHSHPLTRDGDIEIEECAGGSCPIR